MRPANDSGNPLLDLGRLLAQHDYSSVCVTPETCRRRHARRDRGEARDLRDAFGWSLPFARTLLPPRAVTLLEEADALGTSDGLLVSKVRYSTLGANLFVHSAYPTLDEDSVFFGPDSYRFASFIGRELASAHAYPVKRILDIGCGTGVGAIVARDFAPGAEIVLADINKRALAYAAVNAELARCDRVKLVESDVLSAVAGTFDVVMANPPYMMDPLARSYRNGGAAHGAALSLRMLEASLPRLNVGGRLLLYTGSAIVDGRDPLHDALQEELQALGWPWRWRELDPDVFGEELELPAYAPVDRIAAVGLVVERPLA